MLKQTLDLYFYIDFFSSAVPTTRCVIFAVRHLNILRSQSIPNRESIKLYPKCFFFTSIRCSYFVATKIAPSVCDGIVYLGICMHVYSIKDGKKVIRFQYGALRHTAIVLSMNVCLCWA